MIEFLRNIFLYDQESPLLFTRFYFWGFYAVILAIYSIIYYKTGGLFFFILLFSTTSNFFIGEAIYKARTPLAKKLFVALSVFLNLGVLAFFKYDYFFTETLNTVFNTDLEVVTHAAKWSNALLGTHFDIGKILPPVGISFFTFQTISYVVDVYLGKVKPVKNMLDFGFYVSFFPQLVAGPIVRAAHFVPQMYKKYTLTRYELGLGAYLILKGLMKKMFVGDYIAVNLIDRVFADPVTYTGFENLMALYGYSLQVYCDFSGYTDIAIGIAQLLGFHLPKNFNSPYKAKSCGEFWKRWHISLSSWLKDYLYIPMGGNRGGSVFTYLSLTIILIFIVLIAGKLWLAPLFTVIIAVIWLLTRMFPGIRLTISTNINLMMTMLLGGLWHGSSWMFVLWGGLNGIGIVVYKFWKKISPYENSTHWLATFWKIFLTFNFITFTRIWFRGESMQGTYDLLGQISGSFGWKLLGQMFITYWKVFVVMLIGYFIHWLPDAFKVRYRDWFIGTPVYLKIIIAALVVFIIYQSLSAELQPFIYFQF
jgi:alginate O-acetyltransferase complex protein AlgI